MDEDMILPEGFEETATPQAEEISEQQNEVNVEDTTNTETAQEDIQQQTLDKIKLKYNHEEKDFSIDEVKILAQKGMNYDKVTERVKSLESDPRLSFVEELANENNMTVDQYLQAVKSQREEQQLNELIQKNIPEELAKEILENRKDREQRQKESQARAKEQQQEKDMQEFLDLYPDVNTKDIPDEVFVKAKQGTPLKFAYLEYQNKQMQTELKIYKQNETNAKRTPIGSTTVHGGTDVASEDDFLAGFNS